MTEMIRELMIQSVGAFLAVFGFSLLVDMPRQYTNRAREPLIFLDFLKLTEKIYYLFTTYQNY